MDKLITVLIASAFIAAAVFIGAVFAGTILWLIYPHIHELFPTAADNGIIALNLKWWDAVCVSWIFGILFKSTQTNKNKED